MIKTNQNLKLKIIFLAIVFCGVFCLTDDTQAATLYCGASSNGDASGLNWDNQCDLPSVAFVRGNTYYIADGDYGSKTMNTAVSGTAEIIIKKATGVDHGTDIGWTNAYGDEQAIFSKLSITTSYWTVDGTSKETISSGHGIKILNTGTTENSVITITSGTSHHIFKYIEIDRGGYVVQEIEKNSIYGQPNVSNMLIQNCYIHDWQGNAITIYGADNVFENNFFLRGYGYGGVHAQTFQLFAGLNGQTSYQKDTIIRNNIFEDVAGTAFISLAGTIDGVDIHGNVFIMTDDPVMFHARTIYDMSNGTTEPGTSNLRVYNNLFYGYPDKPQFAGDRAGVFVVESPAPETNHVYNNYFYNCIGTYLDQINANHDYNYFLNSTLASTALQSHETSASGDDPTVDGAGYYFGFITKSQAGLMLSAPFSAIDPEGITRGLDGDWDIGVYEYISGNTVALQSPSGLFVQ